MPETRRSKGIKEGHQSDLRLDFDGQERVVIKHGDKKYGVLESPASD